MKIQHWVVCDKDANGNIVEHRYNNPYDAIRHADRAGLKTTDVKRCSCGDSTDSMMACQIHGVSAQLDRTQME